MGNAAVGRGVVEKRRSDVRVGAVAATLAVVLLLGALLGQSASVREQWRFVRQTASAIVVPPQAVQARARNEIKQRFRQGVVMLNMKQYDHALTAFHRVLQLDPIMPEAHVNAGFALLGKGNPGLAKGFFQAAVDLDPNRLNAYWGLALALEAEGDLEKAIGAMRVYAHLSKDDDPYRRKAWAALWEWENRLKADRAAAADGQSSPARGL